MKGDLTMTHDIITWAVTADAAGSPVIIAAEPNAEECRSALVLVRLNPAAKRYAVEPVGVTDAGLAARLAREAVAAAFRVARTGPASAPETWCRPSPPRRSRPSGSTSVQSPPRILAGLQRRARCSQSDGFDPDDPRVDPDRAELAGG
jgi:hypothetical protein